MPKLGRKIEIEILTGLKTCKTCAQTKPLDEFQYIATRHYHNANCKVCLNEHRRTKALPKSKKQGKLRLERDLERGWKTCSRCKQQKTLDLFIKSSPESHGHGRYYPTCKSCELEKGNTRRNGRLEQARAEARAYWKKARQTPGLRERIKEEKKRYHQKNNGLDSRMRGAIRTCLQGEKKGKSWKRLVDFTPEALRSHIETQFTEGMTWDRFQAGEIHIDHILPIALFTFVFPTDPQFKMCWALKNLRPAWGRDNVAKTDRLPDGRLARDLTPQEKLDYLRSLGYDVSPSGPTQHTDQARPDPSQSAPSDPQASALESEPPSPPSDRMC